MESKQYTLKLTAGLFTLLFVVTFLNNELMSRKKTSENLTYNEVILSSRLPASANVNWEADLIKKYTSGFRDQKDLIIGKRPDNFDKFTFGTLNGSYSINYLGGKISSLQFNETQNSNEPQIIEDTHRFLVKNKNILAVDFSTVAKINERNDGKGIYEEYGLFDVNLVKVATAEIKTDLSRHILSLTLKTVSDGQIASN